MTEGPGNDVSKLLRDRVTAICIRDFVEKKVRVSLEEIRDVLLASNDRGDLFPSPLTGVMFGDISVRFRSDYVDVDVSITNNVVVPRPDDENTSTYAHFYNHAKQRYEGHMIYDPFAQEATEDGK